MPLHPGTRLGPYAIAAQIGEGGMGEVYQATDTNLARQVAIKVLPASVAADPERFARFDREAKTLAALNHPNIAQIHGLEKSAGTIALVMELVEGPTLADRIAQGAIPVDEALPIAKQIAEALEAAHEQGIIHRDLKPANIKVRADGTVKVLDFGLAKALEPASALGASAGQTLSQAPTITTPAMTMAGMILGTAAYMSPEQARGKPLDKRADIWAFGCVLYEMLAGKRAFAGEDVTDTLAAVVRSEPSWDALPDAVSPTLRVYLRRCLHKDSKQRVGDIRDMRLALEGAFETGVSRAGESLAAPQPVWRRALPLALAAALGAVTVGFLTWNPLPQDAPVVTRFTYDLPDGTPFRIAGQTIMAFSADGRHFVYNTQAGGGLYLRTMGELEARLILGTQEFLTSPFFSPDGESVGYVQGGELKRIAISGGAPVIICAATNPSGISWALDDTILFGQSDGSLRVSANGGTPALAIPATEGEQMDGPQLLPDGESVLFSVTTATGTTRWDQAQIVVQSLATGERTVVLSGGSDARYVPTGHLVYALRDALFAVAFDADRLEVQGRPVSVVEGVRRSTAGNTATANYGVSDQGTLVYAAGASILTAPRTLVWVDRQGREEAIPAPARPYVYLHLSPDGTKIALDIRDQENDIWVWDVTRTFLTRLTFDPGLDRRPVWTPDGQRIAFSSQREGVPNLFWQAADGTGAVERLKESANNQFPTSFSPDGARLVVGDTANDIAILTLAGERQTAPLIQTTFSERNGEISPDGRWLAYESTESGEEEIYVRPFPDVDAGKWQVSTGGGSRPLWAQSGEELFYLAPDGAVMRLSAEGAATFRPGLPTQLFQGPYFASVAEYAFRTYDVSPDGQRFLMIKEGATEGRTRAGFTVVQNWFEELKRLAPVN